MIIVARKREKDGLKELQEQCIDFNELVNEVLLASDGCSNTKRLVACLNIVYVAVDVLEKELRKNWL